MASAYVPNCFFLRARRPQFVRQMRQNRVGIRLRYFFIFFVECFWARRDSVGQLSSGVFCPFPLVLGFVPCVLHGARTPAPTSHGVAPLAPSFAASGNPVTAYHAGGTQGARRASLRFEQKNCAQSCRYSAATWHDLAATRAATWSRGQAKPPGAEAPSPLPSPA